MLLIYKFFSHYLFFGILISIFRGQNSWPQTLANPENFYRIFLEESMSSQPSPKLTKCIISTHFINAPPDHSAMYQTFEGRAYYDDRQNACEWCECPSESREFYNFLTRASLKSFWFRSSASLLRLRLYQCFPWRPIESQLWLASAV